MGLTLYGDGAFAGWAGGFKIKYVLAGTLAEGRDLIHVDWPGSAGQTNNDAAHEGMINLFEAIVANLSQCSSADPMYVGGHSGFAQVINKLLREKGAELYAEMQAAGKDYDCIRFFKFGDPEGKFTGACYLAPDKDKPVYPGNPAIGGLAHTPDCPTPPEFHGGYGVGYGLPDPCPWWVEVVIIQYDGWADAPVNPEHEEIDNHYDMFLFFIPRKVWDYGLFSYAKSSECSHGEYDEKDGTVALDDDSVFSHVDPDQPTVTYHYIRRYPFIGYDRIARIRFIARYFDMKNRVDIDVNGYGATDATHGRQVTIDPPNYSMVRSWIPLDP